MVRSLVVTLFLLIACTSANDRSIHLIPPEITILPLDLYADRPPRATNFSTLVRIDIQNRSSEPLVLEQVELSSIGVGPFTIAPTIRSFNFTIPPDRRARAEVWVQVTAEDMPGGAEGNIMIRGVATFQSPTSGFRRIFVQRMDVRPVPPRRPN